MALLGQAAVDTVVDVTLPVAVVLFAYEWGTLSGAFDAAALLRRAGRLRPVIAAALGAIPGCAGSIAVSRLFVDGAVDGASLLAAHLATSGDASFVLLVGRPLAAIGLFGFAFALASLVGLVAFYWSGTMACPPAAAAPSGRGHQQALGELPGAVSAAPAGESVRDVVGQCSAGDSVVGPWTVAWWVLAAATGMLVLLRLPAYIPALLAVALAVPLARSRPSRVQSPPARGRLLGVAGVLMAREAAEITLWVAATDFAYTLARVHGEARLVGALATGGAAVVVLAALIGAIPGCGPQILLARLFTAGNLPLPAMVASTVGQHGDAIFPLLGRDRRAALWVTVGQLLVAVVVGLLAVHLMA